MKIIGKKGVFCLFLPLFYCLMIVNFLQSCSEKPLQKIQVNIFNSIADIGVIYAKQTGLFQNAGFDVQFIAVSDGGEAVEQMLIDNELFVRASSYVFIKKVLEGRDVRYIATIATARNFYEFLALGDTDFYSLSDLEGSRIGVVSDTLDHFYAEYAFTFNNVPTNTINFIPIERGQAVYYLQEKLVDAVVVNAAEIQIIRKELENGGRIIPSGFIFDNYLGIIVPADYDSETITKILAVIKKSNEEITALLDENIDFLSEITGFTYEQLMFVKENVSMDVGMDHLLLLASESQMRWLLRKFNGESDPFDISTYFDSSLIENLD